MKFIRYEPPEDLNHLVECYWVMQDEKQEVNEQKIIPDGFPEIIFHFGDLYEIKMGRNWCVQNRHLFAGQITQFFFLRNTGTSDMLGLKLQPTAPAHLFGVDMHSFNDGVFDLKKVLGQDTHEWSISIQQARGDEERINLINDFLRKRNQPVWANHPADRAIREISARHGMLTISELIDSVGVGERHLEKLFRKYVGLSPKFYSRVIRLSHLFQLIRNQPPDWSDLVYQAGFYDQSHFIRNFKAFTGEDPSRYLFSEKNLANFFLKK